MMATTLRAFHTGLYEEHLEEISFLYEQRKALLQKTGTGWQDLAAPEERIEAHLDALVVGGDLALEVCRRIVAEGDFGQLFGCVNVYCRQRQVALLAEVMRDLDTANPKKVNAVADALRESLPVEWAPFVAQALGRNEARLLPVLAPVAGHLRLDATTAALTEVLARNLPQAQPVVEALGRLRSQQARPTLSAQRSHVDASVRSATLLALLRSGCPDELQAALEEPKHEPRQHITLALAAGLPLREVLLAEIQSGQPTAEGLLALGLLGDPGSLRALYDTLEHPELAEVAAQALQWVTGASMDEDIFVPEEVDEALLFKKELQAWQQYKQPPRRLDGQPFGEMGKKLSTDKEAWKRWFAGNASRFDPSLRYRSGQPVSPASLLSDLMAPGASAALRRYTALELEIRYGCDVPFEIDMTVRAQIGALRQMATWVQANGARFQPGGWYFGGAVL